MSNAASSIKKLSSVRVHINAYSDQGAAAKDLMHSSGRAFLRALAKDLGLTKGEFDIRSNMAGIAVSGEVTLHANALYVQLSESCMSIGVHVLFRSCKGRKDYRGGCNNWSSIKSLADGDYDRFVAQCNRLMELEREREQATA